MRSLHVPSPLLAAPKAGARPHAIAVAADDPDRRERIAAALQAAGLSVTAVVESSDDLENGYVDHDSLVLGLDLTALASSSRLRGLRESLRSLPLTVVSPALTPIGIRRAIDAGVDGLVLEQDLDRALAPTLLSVAAGQISVPREAGPQLQGPALTTREREVLRMVALGFKNFEIGQKLFLAESTVKSHLSSAFAKLGVRSRSEAAALLLDTPAAAGILGTTLDR